MELEPGSVVDRYTVEGLIGEGGMAVVYRVRHNQLGTLHALKVLTITSRSVRERLLQEGRVQAQLRHPNIVAVLDFGRVEGEADVVFAHKSGFMCKTRATEPARLRELVQAAWTTTSTTS